jgi:hypothetical protein
VRQGDAFPDWVELHNPGVVPVSLANWSLTDDGDPRKYVFPAGATVSAGGYLVVWCADDTPTPGLHTGFALGRKGETLRLFDAATNRADALSFGLQVADLTVGRVGTAWQLTQPTPGNPNLPAALAPPTNLAINEWLAAPEASGADWIELFNRSAAAPVRLQGLHLGTGEALDCLDALSFLGPRQHVQLFADEQPGPDHLEFKLPASGGVIVLLDATGLELERVAYGPQTRGVSEGRLPDGDDRIVSFAGSVSPGAPNRIATEEDSDGDGLPDEWEQAHHTNPAVPDADEDPDGDGMSNLDEYRAGTDPQSAASVLALRLVALSVEGATLEFTARPARAYAVVYQDVLGEDSWTTLVEVPAGADERTVGVTHRAAPANTRFYRLILPSPLPFPGARTAR